ncbi:hypothetical protein F4804DRAFT_318602 [Jackrogersella minutella]|nr:hypothetical protein F4804DRAFT_318602 [Jackrogersella minutella]
MKPGRLAQDLWGLLRACYIFLAIYSSISILGPVDARSSNLVSQYPPEDGKSAPNIVITVLQQLTVAKEPLLFVLLFPVL